LYFTFAYSMTDEAARASDGRIAAGSSFRGEEVERYSRQMLLPQVGVRGQKLLRDSRILIVGAGGLGCPAAMYLAGAGIGTVGLVDRPGDLVERSNLHRQIAHTNARVGMDKVASVATAILALNPLVAIRTHSHFAPDNAVELAREYDVVLDCTDNVASRYLINDACAAARTPLVSGSAIGLEGQLTVYGLTRDTPCYRCVFPVPPPPSCVGSCASAGVLGPVPGTIGTLQALEALKILAKIDGAKPLAGRLLLFDATEAVFRTVKLRGRVGTCIACCDAPTLVVSDFNYHAFAAGKLGSGGGTDLPAAKESPLSLPDEWRIAATDLKCLRDAAKSRYHLVDVRPAEQFAMCSLPEAQSIPFDTMFSCGEPVNGVINRIAKLAVDARVVVMCRRGNKSQEAVRLLQEHGVSPVVDVKGGLEAWHYEVDTTFPLY
jgi:adenylyltransferase and sulfurtransferase